MSEKRRTRGGLRPPWRVAIYFRWPGSRRPYRERRRAPPEITSKSAAQRWGEAREAYMLAQGETATLVERAPEHTPADAPPPVPTLREFAPDWLDKHLVANLRKRSTYVTAKMILDLHLLPILGDKRLDAIDDEAIASLRAAWLAGSHGERPTSSKKTINNRLSILSTVLHVAKKWKRLPAMPCTIELLKVDDHEEAAFYEPATYERIVQAARAIDLERSTPRSCSRATRGLRRGEIIALALVRTSRSSVTRRGSSSATTCSSRRAGAGDRGHAEGREGQGPAMHAPPGRCAASARPHGTARARAHHAEDRQALDHPRGVAAAGLPETGRVHVYRHTFASHLAMASVPAKTIQGLARHVSIMTTARYMHLSPSAADAGIDALDAWRRGTDVARVDSSDEKS